MASKKKPTHYIFLGNGRKMYFSSYSDAKDYIKMHWPMNSKGIVGLYHIYPVDKSGYFSKSDGRKSFGEGNKEWEKKNDRKKS
jgi:hypothetical protein